jgi:excinuclease ABC subunit C
MSRIDLPLKIIERKKNKSINQSSLDRIKGLGPKRKRNLMHAFKSIQAIKTASANDLSKVPGISIKLAKEINSFYIQ